jgi:hypothetical protein
VQGIQDQCNAKNFVGPPNKGKVLTPKKKSIEVGQIMATVGGGIEDSPTPKTSKTQAPAKETPAANDNKPETPAQTPAKTTQAAAPQAPKPTPSAPKPTDDTSYPAQPAPKKEEEEPANKPSPTTTPPASASKPTKGPACVPGGVCVTVTEIEVVTQTVYVTAPVNKRGTGSLGSFRGRKRAHRA